MSQKQDSSDAECDVDKDISDARRRHERASSLQRHVKSWMERKGYLFETGIRHPERKLAIYVPKDEPGEKIHDELLNAFPDIENQAIITDLKSDNRERLAMHPGHTPLFFGNGSSGTLGTFLHPAGEDTFFALSSFHGADDFSIIGRDVFIKLQDQSHFNESPGIYRLGKVVGDVKQNVPVIDACLIEVDEGISDQIELSMFFNDPGPPLLYLKMHENAENLGAEGVDPIHVAKYGYGTTKTDGVVVEYSRDLIENGNLLTDNIVTRSKDPSKGDLPTDNIVTRSEVPPVKFAGNGDCGSIVFRPVRMTHVREDGTEISFCEAISLLYMADSKTGEAFSIPLPRCLRQLGNQVGKQLELATERYHPH